MKIAITVNRADALNNFVVCINGKMTHRVTKKRSCCKAPRGLASSDHPGICYTCGYGTRPPEAQRFAYLRDALDRADELASVLEQAGSSVIVEERPDSYAAQAMGRRPVLGVDYLV